MKRSLVIFGTGETAEMAHYHFCASSNYEIAAFTVDADYIRKSRFCGLPVVEFENITRKYPPKTHDFFIALGYSKINETRKEKFFSAKNKGYKLASFISPHATVLNSGQIGENCFIFEDNTIQPFVKIGNNVVLWSGNHIGHHSIIKDHVFISSHVVISGCVEIGEQCFIGVNATLRDRIKVGNRCVVGAGALLLNDADPDGVYIGTTAKRSKVPSTRLRVI